MKLISLLNAKHKAYRINCLPVGLELTDAERVSLYGRRKETGNDTAQRTRGEAKNGTADAAEDSQQQRNMDA